RTVFREGEYIAARGIQARQRSLLTRPAGTLFRDRRVSPGTAGKFVGCPAVGSRGERPGPGGRARRPRRRGPEGHRRPHRAGCAGWAVTDVLYHQLLDARRALRTFASPSDAPVDRDDVSYWRDYAPAKESGPDGDGAAAHADESAAHARYVRIAASAYPPGTL